MNVSRLKLIGIIVLLLSLLLTSCATPQTVPGTSTSQPTTATTTRTVTDMAGRTVVIPAKVNRIAIAFQATNQIIHMLGSPEKICGTVPSIKTVPLYIKVYPKIMDIPTPFDWGGTTGVINYESLVATHPDVVLLYQDTGSDLDKLKQLGIPVIMVPPFFTPEEIMKSVQFIGDVLGEKERAKAEEYVQYYQANIKKATAISFLIPANQKVRVYFSTHATNPLQTEGKGRIAESWLAHGGGISVAAEAGIDGNIPIVNIENIIQWNPDAIICTKQGAYQEIVSNPAWRTIKALKNNRVYQNPIGMYWWCVRSTEEALQTLWTGTVLHPDEYRDFDMVKETKAFYLKFHNYTLNDQEVQSILYPPMP